MQNMQNMRPQLGDELEMTIYIYIYIYMDISYDQSLETTYYKLDVWTYAVFTAQVGRLSESVYRGHVTEPSVFTAQKTIPL